MQGSRRVWHTGLVLVACLGLDALRPVSAEDVDATALALVEQRNLGVAGLSGRLAYCRFCRYGEIGRQDRGPDPGAERTALFAA